MKVIFIGIVLFFIFISCGYAQSCVDIDGNDPFSVGGVLLHDYTYYYQEKVDGVLTKKSTIFENYTHKDSCVSENVLYEYYCVDQTDYKLETVTCEFGCVYRSCKKSVNDIPDSPWEKEKQEKQQECEATCPLHNECVYGVGPDESTEWVCVPSDPLACSDTDGGIEKDIPGKVSGVDRSTLYRGVQEDHCTGGLFDTAYGVIEYYCEDGYVKEKEIRCPHLCVSSQERNGVLYGTPGYCNPNPSITSVLWNTIAAIEKFLFT